MLLDTVVCQVLKSARTIAVIGAKDRSSQPVDRVGRYLISAGYAVIPVHPVRTNVWGLTTYKNLADVPVPVDLVNVFRNAQFCAEHARETVTLGKLPMLFWMQSGIRSSEAGAVLSAHGVKVVEDKCIMVEHHRLLSRVSAF